MRKLLLPIVALLGLVVADAPAEACRCPFPTLGDAISEHTHVFVGRLAGSAAKGYTVTVEGVWKGTVPATVTIDAPGREMSTCDMIAQLAKAERWLLIGQVRDGHFFVSICSGSQPATAAVEAAVTKALGAPRKP